MKLSEALSQPGPRPPAAQPNLTTLGREVAAVMAAFPDVSPKEPPDIERRIADFRAWFDRGMTGEVLLADAIVVAEAVFSETRRTRGDLDGLRDFFIDQTIRCEQPAFRKAMVRAYLGGWRGRGEQGASATQALAGALQTLSSAAELPPPWSNAVRWLPELFDAEDAPVRIARRLAERKDPDRFLRRDCEVPDPQATGLFDRVHDAILSVLSPRLAAGNPYAVRTMLNWLCPEARDPRLNGAAEAVSALLEPWETQSPEPSLRQTLRDTLTASYGDPRLRPGAIWPRVSAAAMSVMHRWLTEQSLSFFFEVISAVEDNGMWERRRPFWERLFRDGRISAAWVALSPKAARWVRANGRDKKVEAARQVAGGTRADTSLLVLQIGHARFVEGSHSYKVHCFPAGHPKAPELYRPSYDCELIRHSLPDDERFKKAHHSEWIWQAWVEEKIREHG